jgi:AraC family transcriptional regulator
LYIGLSSEKMPSFSGPPDQFVSTGNFRSADLVSSKLIGESGSMPVARWRSSLGRDAVTQGYSHHTVILQNAGEDVRRIDSEKFAARRSRPGSLLILPARMEAAWRSENISDRTHYYLHPELLEQVSREIQGKPCNLRDDCIFILDNGLAEQLQHYSFLLDSTTSSRFERELSMLNIVATLVRRYTDLSPQGAGQDAIDKGERLVRFIEDNLAEQLKADDIAQAIGVSPATLKRLARERLGNPLHDYVVGRRLEVAAELIGKGLPIAQVAQDCGFSSQSHLSTSMKSRSGVTPASLAPAKS